MTARRTRTAVVVGWALLVLASPGLGYIVGSLLLLAWLIHDLAADVLPPGCTCPDERHTPDIALQPGMRVVACRSVHCPTSRPLHFHTIQPDQGCLLHGGNPS